MTRHEALELDYIAHNRNWYILFPADLRRVIRNNVENRVSFIPDIKEEDVTNDTYAFHYMATGWACCYIDYKEGLAAVKDWVK